MNRKDELLKQVFEFATNSESVLDSIREKLSSKPFFSVDFRYEGRFLIWFEDVS